MSCALQKEGWFCGLPGNLLREFADISFIAPYPSDSLLFVEGQRSRNAFVICSGQAELSFKARNGESFVLRSVDAGEIVGLDAILSGAVHLVTAMTTRPSVITRIKGDRLLQLIERHGLLGLRSALAIGREVQSVYHASRQSELAEPSRGTLAPLLLL